jgi:TatD DNase family protein
VHPHDAAGFDAARDEPAIRAAVAAARWPWRVRARRALRPLRPREAQRARFGAQLALAARAARPVVVHTREAEDDTRDDARRGRDGVRGVLHCYTGSAALAEARSRPAGTCRSPGS